MSLNSLPKIDQKEYLKRYLSGDKVKKKKKDKKHKKSKEKVRIIDDDVYDADNGPKIDEELLLTGDDAPQIVGEYIEDTQSAVPRWKSIAIKDEPEDEHENKTNIKKEDNDLWGRKASDIKIKQEPSDTSPPRRKDKKKKSRSSPDSSPPLRRDRKNSGDFISPKRKHSNSGRDKKNTENSPSRHLRQKSPDQSPVRKERISRFNKQSPARCYSRSPDHSPPRRRKSSDHSPPRRRNQRSPDQSPPRRKNYEKSPSPIRRRRDSDQSPPRNKRTSPSRLRRNSDQSPPRKHNKNRDELLPRRRKNSDQSPPRHRRNSDQSPPRHRRNSDQSPPRRRRNSNQSPPRQSRNLDKSPPRRGRKRSPSNPSPPRRSRRDTYDQSPPRKGRGERMHSPPSISMKKEIKQEKLTPPPTSPTPQRKSRWERNSDSPPPTHKPKAGKTLDGKTAGLQDAKALKAETNERRRQEDQLFEKMSAEVSGRNAEVKVRSTGRQGRRAREAREEDPEERRRKEEMEQKKKEEYERLSKGIKQIEDYRKRKAEMEHESNKPLARYSNDDDLERHLKEQERAEDPMLEYMRKKRKEKEKDSGKPQKPQYEGPYPENRFGIHPGHRWDGVDRSNGYEKRWFDVQNAKKATQDEAYKFSVEDL